MAATYGAHSSIQAACDVMDAELVEVPADDRWRLTGAHLRRTLEEHDPATFFAVVATAGTTNFGIIDDLASVAEVCADLGIWFHVDGAYGGAALAAPSVRDRFVGVERADSFIVDPHKWLFAPFDCCALLYRDPALARAAHTQHAGYLDVLTEGPDWNPSDLAVGLTRRARGLPLWFSLAVHGTDAYARTRSSAPWRSPASPRRRSGGASTSSSSASATCRSWCSAGWAGTRRTTDEWSDRLLADEFAFVVPTTHDGETVTRFADRQPDDDRGRHPRHPRHDDLRGDGVNDSGVISPYSVATMDAQRHDDDDRRSGVLAARDREILAFERQWWKYAGAKEQAIKELFDMSATRYYQVLNALIDTQSSRSRPTRCWSNDSAG